VGAAAAGDAPSIRPAPSQPQVQFHVQAAAAPAGLPSRLAEVVAAALGPEALQALGAPGGGPWAAGLRRAGHGLRGRAASSVRPARRTRSARRRALAPALAAVRSVSVLPASAATTPGTTGAERAAAARAHRHEPAAARRSRSRSHRPGGDRGGRAPLLRRDGPAPPPPAPPGAAGASGSSAGAGAAAGLVAALVGGLPLGFPSFFTRLAGAAVARRQEPAGPRLERPG